VVWQGSAGDRRPYADRADIHLGEGRSGVDAVVEILRSFDIAVILCTAYRPDLITKPFLPQTVGDDRLGAVVPLA
jgi:hypothetical protein